MLTKTDIKIIKDLFKPFATKDDLKPLATKDDLKTLATKDDFNKLEKKIDTKFTQLFDCIDFLAA